MTNVVLPSIRLNRFRQELEEHVDRDVSDLVMELLEKHLETDSYRWGNACPEEYCHRLLSWTNDLGFRCPTHGILGRHASTQLLIAFSPITSVQSDD
jgi:hypothetical protein